LYAEKETYEKRLCLKGLSWMKCFTRYKRLLFAGVINLTMLLNGCANTRAVIMDIENMPIEISETTEETSSEQGNEPITDVTTETTGIIIETTKQPEEIRIPEKEVPKVKGIYVTGPIAGSEYMEHLITLIDETELNTVVIDVKNDSGEITWHMENPLVEELDAYIRFIPDIDAFLKKMKEHNIYTIARIVCFKDPILAAAKPELAMTTPNGKVITDSNGLAWVNPYKQEVWDYLLSVSISAAEVGFDEIQYDYVRFATGNAAESVDFAKDGDTRSKQDVIAGFLTAACETLHPLGVKVSADVFGTIMGSDIDTELVGQDYTRLGEIVDYLCPMVYPSHYGEQVFGLDVPDAYPYETVFHAMEKSKEELEEIPEDSRTQVRAWLQAFTATWIKGHIEYGGEEIRKQIQAVYDAGYEEWILWNASNHYEADGLKGNAE